MKDYQLALSQAADFIGKHHRFLLVNHVNPDGDATASLLAMGMILKKLGKEAVMANEGSTPQKFSFLSGFQDIQNASLVQPDEKFTAIITCDCGDFSRVGQVAQWFAEGYELLNIDHHPTNDGFGTVNLVRTNASATAEVIYDLMKEMKVSFFPELATCIYTGLMTDTGGFRYSNTTSYVMNIASELLAHQVRPDQIADRVLESITRAHLALLKRALLTLEFGEGERMASLTVTHQDMVETGALSEDLDGIVHYARNIEGIEVGILYKEQEDGNVKVSLRSKEYINVAEIALSLGGGGHIRAAGCTIRTNLAEAKKIINEKLKEAFLRQEEGE
jgi:phosphoesterase RecJ-like protein